MTMNGSPDASLWMPAGLATSKSFGRLVEKNYFVVVLPLDILIH